MPFQNVSADMHDVRLGEGDGDVAVGMGGAVILQADRRAIELEAVLAREHLAGNSAGWQRKEIVVPVLDALDLGQILAGVFLRDDLGAGRVQPGIAVGMVEVPVRIDQVRDRDLRRAPASALVICGRETPMPASTSTLPSGPVSTATLPPEPSSTLILLRSL